jgi:NADH-quinone oxidoreductase subunit J
VVVQNIAFWILAVAMVLAAIGVVRSQNVVHAALYLVVVLGGGAAQYILLAAEFVAWVQVLIYIGAVIILFLFGIMLTRAPMGGDTNLDNDQRWPAAVVSVFLLGVLATLLIDAFSDAPLADADVAGVRAHLQDLRRALRGHLDPAPRRAGRCCRDRAKGLGARR